MLAADTAAPIDLVLACAGVSAGPRPDGTPEGGPLATLQIRSNLLGAVNTIEPLLPRFLDRAAGHIAVVSSVAGLRGLPFSPAYSASKAGVRAYGEALRAFLGPRGVAVSVIVPGFFDTPMTDRFKGAKPFLKSLDATVALVRRGLDRRSPRIVFPRLLAAGLTAADLLPAWAGDRILPRRALPHRARPLERPRPVIPVLIGLAVCLAAWTLVLRRGAGALAWRGSPPIAKALDVAPVVLGYAALLGTTARPYLAALIIVALTAGLSAADRVKRAVLHEPVVFADRAELPEVVRHPGLYFPFAGGPGTIAAIVAGIAALIAALAWAEPPLWHRSMALAAIEATLAAGLAAACFAIPGAWPALLDRLAALYTTRLAPTRDPARDAARLGPLATLAIHATLAAAERPARRRSAISTGTASFPAANTPIVVVQAESFLDPARLHHDLATLLPNYRALCASARQTGKLGVPAWGANTVRSEFAVLTGVAESALGLDYYNPYEKFARAPGPDLPSLARAARTAGYRTIFVHPFDLGFYNRRRVLPLLGFDQLVGPADFAGARRSGPYIADEAVAETAAALLRRHGPRVFLYVATMEAHGPWDGPGPTVPAPAQRRSAAAIGRHRPLARPSRRHRPPDRVADPKRSAPPAAGWPSSATHQPSMPEAFAAAGLTDRRTDYVPVARDSSRATPHARHRCPRARPGPHGGHAHPMTGRLILDVSRTLSRAAQPVPTGIDRVEMAYAEHLLDQAGDRLDYAAMHPIGRYGSLPAGATRRFLAPDRRPLARRQRPRRRPGPAPRPPRSC